MRQTLTLILIFAFSNLVKGQTLALSITDTINAPLLGATVYINNSKKAVSNGSILYLNINHGDRLKVTSAFYRNHSTLLDMSKFINDTLRLVVTLNIKPIDLDAVVINSEKTKEFYNVENSNVIDYYPFQDLCLYLVKEQNQRYIQLNRGSSIIAKKRIANKPNSIFLDGFGNFHVISEDSVHHVWFNEDKVEYLNAVAINTFESQIKPLIGKTDQSVFTQKYIYANKFYTIDCIGRDTISNCYVTNDKVAHQMAKIQERQIIGKYYAAVPAHLNIIELGLWDGDLAKLQTHADQSITDDVGWYKAALDNPIHVEAFGMENCIAVVDLFKDSVSVLDYNAGKIIKNSKLNNPILGKPSLYYDYFNDAIYLIDKTANGIHIYRLNPITGVFIQQQGIYDIPFVENIKIAGDWVYFEIRERTGFNKILRQRII